MNRTVMQGKWKQMRGAMQEEWGRLTQDDFDLLLGKGEQLVGRLQERYGYTRQEAEDEVRRFLDRFGRDDGFAAQLSDAIPERVEQTMESAREHPGIVMAAIASVVVLGIFVLRQVTRSS